ncbi:uncharacterized protein PAC_01819 [Phialocephala subalpina]|uniref:ORC6 first cyclin-like domain-containing protein n=1 Tax=Phialocephala subalpina TaxID=576137 RepID=A0A1L7WGP2_9HELO|nr:uncharacterized protein PAC_01819 [Phialocephala subalpina]
MSRPIERTLTNLIPRHSGTLPRELIDLADSLLSQSRNKCSLKPDEEIARVYACANLACERLKTILNLPQIESHPPIPPRAYTKLYAYFDRTLQTSAARAKAQRSARSTPSKPLPQRGTPNKEQSFKSFSTSTPSHRTPKRGLKHASKPEKESKIPRWIECVTRHLCKSMETPKAYPHILAGVETLLSSPCPNPEIEAMVSEEKGNRNVPALIASIWFLVVVRMREKDRRGFETSARQKMARDVIAGAREDEWVVKRVGEGEEGWKGWEGLVVGDVMGWNREVNGRGWKGLDWWLNVPEGSGVEGEMADVDVDQELGREEEDEIVVGGRERKPDTMYQAKYDYLSVDKRAEYREWKEEMLAMMQELRGQDEDTAMADA